MNMKLRYSHYRIPRIVDREYPRRGSPSKHVLIPYSRELGWCGQVLKGKSTPPFERGGRTMCEVVDKDGNVLSTGEAVCSFSDNFNYSLGRLIASGRALSDEFLESALGGKI